MHLSKDIINLNKELSIQQIKLRIEQRGEKLNIRGPFPSRSIKGVMKTQRLSLGIPATQGGLKEASKIVQLICLQIEREQFQWQHWTPQSDQKLLPKAKNDVQISIEGFRDTFFKDPIRQRSLAGARSTWRGAYAPYLKRLIKTSNLLNHPINYSLIEQTLNSYSENSRSRQQCSIALHALAKYLGIKLPDNWKTKAGGYGLHKALFRELPTEETILDCFSKIPNKKWRLVYGLMATYGLRNHEVFFCDLSCFKENGDRVLRVLPHTKTGEHQVWPFPPNWVDLFGLSDLSEGKDLLPKVNTDLNKTTLQQVGKRAAEQFKRYKLPIKPYDLRHAWAVRTIHIGLPDTVAARMMGHSVAIHTKNYHHWITRRDQQKAVDTALSRAEIKIN